MGKPDPAAYGITAKLIEEERQKAAKRADYKNPQYWTVGTTVVLASIFIGGWAGANSEAAKSGGLCFGIVIGFVVGVVLAIQIDGNTKEALKADPRFVRYIDAVARYETEAKATAEAQFRKQESYWYSMSGWAFEVELAKLFERQGYSASVTPGSGDGGIDIELRGLGINRIIIQCKAHRSPVGPKEVRELYGVFCGESTCDKAVLVSLGGFTQGARQFAAGKPIVLMSLVEVMRLSNGESIPM